ncbi:MAG: ABC transporter permease [Rubellimicrobium sp.]|nr:ABC transporter permease [Rubellimicrobium sp.]
MNAAAPLATLGRATLAMLGAVGRFTIWLGQVLSHVLRPPFYAREFRNALMQIGYLSLPVVGLTALFTGGALALQIYAGSSRFDAQFAVPQIVAIGVVRELGPVMVGLMIAARVTSSIAAEIATMRVTEQIDALVTLSTHPLKYLAAPRVLAGVVVVPLLVAVGDILGILGGWLVAVTRLDFATHEYLQNTVDFLDATDITSSLVKGAAFGLIATATGCYAGMNAGRGAIGVGRATKSSVVMAAVMVLAANLLLTEMFFSR